MNLLDFEKPIAELEGKLADMKHLADGSDDSVKKAVEALEKKITDLKKETFENLTGWQRVQLSRHRILNLSVNFVGNLTQTGIQRLKTINQGGGRRDHRLASRE